MHPWLEKCENWLVNQYKTVLGVDLTDDLMQIRWLSEDSISTEVPKQEAQGMVIQDSDIGWMLFLLPYDANCLERQVNQALGLRSKLLRESNYSGDDKVGDTEDANGSWRVGLVWLVHDNEWCAWQDHILRLRRESGMAEEIAIDAVRVEANRIQDALTVHGFPRLLLHTRALLRQSATEMETWRSADAQILDELQGFSTEFDDASTRSFARDMEERAKGFSPVNPLPPSSVARQFSQFRVKHFRNLDDMEVVAGQTEDNKAQAIVLFGPNGTGKSSFAEALSLAAFGTSHRLERYLEDKDLRGKADAYLKEYLTPINSAGDPPSYVLNQVTVGDKEEGVPFVLNSEERNKRQFDGVVLNQEDSIDFTKMSREELAAQVLKGYSALSDHLSIWLEQEEKRAKETKSLFTRKHGLSGSVKLSSTAYKGLANRLLQTQLPRPSPEFLEWLRFWARMSDEDGKQAAKLESDWANQQANVIDRLSGMLAKLQAKGAKHSLIAQEIQANLDEIDRLAGLSVEFRDSLLKRISTLSDQIDNALSQIEVWGVWLASQSTGLKETELDTKVLKAEIDRIAAERVKLEKDGKTLRGRLDLLDQSKQFLSSYWSEQHPDTCPVCNSDVSKQQGIEMVVSTLQEETNATIQALRTRYLEIQSSQKNMDAKLQAAGKALCPLAAEDQKRLREWLTPFLSDEITLESRLVDPQHLEKLKKDLARMTVLPDTPKIYADTKLEAERLANDFIALSQEADRALEDPQAIGEVKKAFELKLGKVLKDHLPSTLGRVWEEITLTLTAASWLLPNRPSLKLEQRGKSLSVQAGESGRHVRYLYNAAECHVLGLAWFFTHYLAKKRFEEAWMLLDDPAQEMDQPSFRELVRFWETLLRLHQRRKRPYTMIIALHQEDRALDVARATNGKLFMLGWKSHQQGAGESPSVKKVVMLAEGFYPLKPGTMFVS